MHRSGIRAMYKYFPNDIMSTSEQITSREETHGIEYSISISLISSSCRVPKIH